MVVLVLNAPGSALDLKAYGFDTVYLSLAVSVGQTEDFPYAYPSDLYLLL